MYKLVGMYSTWLAIALAAVGVYSTFGQDKPEGTAEGARVSGRAVAPVDSDVRRDARSQAASGATSLGLCDVARDPLAYSGKLVAIRGAVHIAFEDFQFSTASCDPRQIDSIWLQYGSGTRAQPTTWCCGNLTPRDSPLLNENAEFRKFHHDLTAQKHSKDCRLGGCYVYDVTATLAGRLDAVPTKLCPDGKSYCCPAGGFGHLGFACARLIIQSVSDVVPKVKPAPGHRSPTTGP